MASLTESIVEDVALAWLEATGWRVAHGPEIAPDMPATEHRDYAEVVRRQRLRDALAGFNPALPADALEDAFRKLDGIWEADAERIIESRRRQIAERAMNAAAAGIALTSAQPDLP